MDVKEKLVELIGSTEYGNGSLVGKNFQKGFIEKIASNLIAHGVTVQEWISVKDKLPDFFGTFLVVVEEDDSDNTLYTDCADYDPFENSWRTFGYFDNGSRIKLWMPLPQPPKGE